MALPPTFWPTNGGMLGHPMDAPDATDVHPCIDSPLEVRQTTPAEHLETQPSAQKKTSTSPGTIDRHLSARKRPSTSRQSSSRSGENGSGGNNVRFVVVNHPAGLRDRNELRKNRQHVMHDYLAKEAANPSSRDARVRGPGYSRKRKISSPLIGTSKNPLAPSHIFQRANATSVDGDSERVDTASPASSEARANMSKVLKVRTGKPAVNNAPLVAGISGRFRNYNYMGTAPDDVPFPLHRMNGRLNPFDTWPKFEDPSVNVNELKWSCSRRFGSRGIADYWVPTMLKARHAFLSTIAISSAHDDIMRRAARPPDQRPKHESVERARVRQEVTSMINESIGNPQMQTADATLVAVLHLLSAAIMGCDDEVMYVHQHGLRSMVASRGGLNSLGVNGQLAMMMTVTMFLIAILRESQPHREFVDFARRQKTTPPKDFRPLPESPVLCRPSGYYTISKTLCLGNQIYSLLEVDRQLTREFLAGQQHHCNRGARSDRRHNDTDSWPELTRMRDEVFTFPPAEEADFAHPSERCTYDAIRLTSRIYAHALDKRISFSASANQLKEAGRYRSLVPGYLSTEAKYTHDCALHIHVRNALMRTDLSDCWGHMAGVLFWIGLVAGAAANPETVREGAQEGEEEEARKWLAAIVVRCMTVLGFEFGPAILDVVKTVQGMQKVLGLSSPSSTLEELGEETVRVAYGPVAPPQHAQHGFSDFARQFDV